MRWVKHSFVLDSSKVWVGKHEIFQILSIFPSRVKIRESLRLDGIPLSSLKIRRCYIAINRSDSPEVCTERFAFSLSIFPSERKCDSEMWKEEQDRIIPRDVTKWQPEAFNRLFLASNRSYQCFLIFIPIELRDCEIISLIYEPAIVCYHPGRFALKIPKIPLLELILIPLKFQLIVCYS